MTGKKIAEAAEKDMAVTVGGATACVPSELIPGLGDDNNGSAAKTKKSFSKGAQASHLQDEQQGTLAIQNKAVSESSNDQTSSETDPLVLKTINNWVSTAENVSVSTIKEASICTVPSTSSCCLENESIVGPKEHGSRKLRSTAPDKKMNRMNASEQSPLNRDMCTYLEPLTKLEGVTSDIKNIESWYHEWTLHCNVTKIAEGSFGSVFKLSDKGGLQEATIGKLMPLRPKTGKGSRKAGYTHVKDAASEIRLLEIMSQVPGFVEFRSAEVLIGGLPKPLKREYRTYKAKCKSKKMSFCETQYPENQMWVFIEMGNAGTELEDALLPVSEDNMILERDEHGQWMIRIQDARDIFWGVTEALANGEEVQEFEHRDLHFSNICIQRKPVREDNGYLLIPSNANIEVTLIDYTLSRATLQNGLVICNSMTDEEVFSGEDDLQFDVYRWMREEMPGQELHSKEWEAFVPRTNVLWLYHLLEKLMLQTTRPDQQGDERVLWESLNELKAQINPSNKQSRPFLSATDVVNYAREGRTSVDESRHDVDQKDSNYPPEYERLIDDDLSARFLHVRI